jgi:TetR/AcrR family fatty acid metabolism transcriptional regulator
MKRFTASWLQDYFALIAEVIEQGQREGTLRADLPVKIATKAFFGVLDEMVTSWILSRKQYDLVALAGPVVDLFLRGAAGPRQVRESRPLRLAVAAGRKR